MSEREWNIILNRHINNGESLLSLCEEFKVSYRTASRYKKRYLESNNQILHATDLNALPPINNGQTTVLAPRNHQNALIPIQQISPVPTQGLFKKPTIGRGDAFLLRSQKLVAFVKKKI
jgi:hypothetical protein